MLKFARASRIIDNPYIVFPYGPSMECKLFNGIGLGCQGMGNAKSMIEIVPEAVLLNAGKKQTLVKNGNSLK